MRAGSMRPSISAVVYLSSASSRSTFAAFFCCICRYASAGGGTLSHVTRLTSLVIAFFFSRSSCAQS